MTSTGYQPKPSSQTSTQAWAARSDTVTCRLGSLSTVKPLTYRAGMPRVRSIRATAEA